MTNSLVFPPPRKLCRSRSNAAAAGVELLLFCKVVS
jgi:hypothetical protein